MELDEGLRLQARLSSELSGALSQCGIPEDAILKDVVLHFPKGEQHDADVVIIGKDGKTIIAQIDIKVGPNAYNNALRSLRDMPKRHKCYVVAWIDGCGMISTINEDRQPKWIKLSDSKGIKEVVGNYTVESNVMTSFEDERKKKMAVREWNWFKWVIGGVGMILVGGLGTLEWYNHEFSWKFYFLMFVILAMFAAASGYIVSIKIGENEVTIEKRKNVWQEGGIRNGRAY